MKKSVILSLSFLFSITSAMSQTIYSENSGMGVSLNVKNGEVNSKGISTIFNNRGVNITGGSEADRNEGVEGLVLFHHEGLEFNVINKEDAEKLSSSLGLDGSAFIGYSFNEGSDGLGFLVGAGARTKVNVGSISKNSQMRNQYFMNLSPETGLVYKNKNFAATITAGVGFGSADATLRMPNGSILSMSNDAKTKYNSETARYSRNGMRSSLSYSGTARVAIGEKVYADVFFMTLEMQDRRSSKTVEKKNVYGDVLSSTTTTHHYTSQQNASYITLFWKVNKKLTLNGGYSSHDSVLETSVNDATPTQRKMKQSNVSLGIIQSF